jgi:hypothetical protein
VKLTAVRAKSAHAANAGGSVMGLVTELWAFMRERKKFWLLPVIIVMVVIGSLLIFAQGSALAPFIYTIF